MNRVAAGPRALSSHGRSLCRRRRDYSEARALGLMAKSVRVSSTGRITLPMELRIRHHLLAGERVIVLDTPGGILVRHAAPRLRGFLRGKLDGEAFEKDLRRLRKGWRL